LIEKYNVFRRIIQFRLKNVIFGDAGLIVHTTNYVITKPLPGLPQGFNFI